MSWQDDVIIEQERADALEYMGEAEWRDMYDDVSPDYEYDILKTNDPDGKKWKKQLYMSEYHKAHRDKANAARKKWRLAHPNEEKERNTKNLQQWREKNREKYNAYQREYHKRKKESIDKRDNT